MNWITLYITGNRDFREDLRKKLSGTKLEVMLGYVDTTTGPGNYDLFWLGEKTSLRGFKEVIGSKLIWKYRLRFYTNLEEFIQSVNVKMNSTEFTAEEQSMMEAMRKGT